MKKINKNKKFTFLKNMLKEENSNIIDEEFIDIMAEMGYDILLDSFEYVKYDMYSLEKILNKFSKNIKNKDEIMKYATESDVDEFVEELRSHLVKYHEKDDIEVKEHDLERAYSTTIKSFLDL